MSQNLNVELTIPIPEDSVLITRTEYDALQKDNLKGRTFTLQQLSERTGMYKSQLKKIFDKPKVRKEVDVEKGGFVSYPETQGSPYLFLASSAIEFIDENFDMLMSMD